jgi:hypothetical protein
VQSRKRFPKEGKIITTSKGEEKVMLNDIFHDRVTLRAPDGESRIVTLIELRQETSGWTPGVTEEHSIADARDLVEEGVLPFDDAPTLLIERTRVPQSDRTLPVLPSALVTPPPPAPPRAKTPVSAPAIVSAPVITPDDIDDDEGGDDEGGDDDSDDTAVGTDNTTGEAVAGESPKRRRRRGRRGGRRGRGNRPPGGDEPAAQ